MVERPRLESVGGRKSHVGSNPTPTAQMQIYAISCKTQKSRKQLEKFLGSLKGIKTGSLVCFPEYFLDGKTLYSGVEFTDDSFVFLRDFARKKGINLAFGMVEKIRDRKYVSGIFLDKKGKMVGKQRKVKLASFEEKAGISPGKLARRVMRTEFGTVSLTVCRDQWFLKQTFDAEIVINSRGYGLDDPKYGKFCEHWLLLDRVAAMLNKAYLVGVTGAVGQASLLDIINFEGKVLAMKREGGLIQAKIDLDLLRKYRKKEFVSKVVPKF